MRKYIIAISIAAVSLLGSLAQADDLSKDELILPMSEIKLIQTCTFGGDGLGIKIEPGDIRESFEWMQKASQDLSANNISGLKYLVKRRILYKQHENIVNMQVAYQQPACKQAVDTVAKTMNTFEKKIKKYLETEDTYEPYTELYIVAARSGVNVRNNPLKGTQSQIIDSLERGTGLRLIEKVKVHRSWWGEFAYTNDGEKHLGWIEMSNLRSTKSNRALHISY